MRQRGFGRVINITGSVEPRSLNAAAAAKAAVHVWAKGLAADVARDGVTVNYLVGMLRYAGKTGEYSDGLAGEDIPLGSRIIAACDAYDAMISHRCYRPARSHAWAREELAREAGRQFDPTVVTALLDALEDGEDLAPLERLAAPLAERPRVPRPDLAPEPARLTRHPAVPAPQHRAHPHLRLFYSPASVERSVVSPHVLHVYALTLFLDLHVVPRPHQLRPP